MNTASMTRDARDRAAAAQRCETFGISHEEHIALLHGQGYHCATGCGRDVYIASFIHAVDGRVRGVLCERCRYTKRHLQHGPPYDWIHLLIEYLICNANGVALATDTNVLSRGAVIGTEA
jgi:hypothetical protein